MFSTLCVNIKSTTRSDKEEIKFYQAEEWSHETEKQFLAKIQDVFSIARQLSKTLQVYITIETLEADKISFLLQRKINNQFEIKDQKLSLREIEVLGLIMEGLTNHEMAEKLFISYETVRSHRKNILEKTGARNTVALINYYHQTFFEK